MTKGCQSHTGFARPQSWDVLRLPALGVVSERTVEKIGRDPRSSLFCFHLRLRVAGPERRFALRVVNTEMKPMFERFLPVFDLEPTADEGETHEQSLLACFS